MPLHPRPPAKGSPPATLPRTPHRILAALLWIGAVSAHAAPGWQPDAAFTQLGEGSSTQSWSAGLQWDWDREWSLARSLVLRGRFEVALGRWRAEVRERDDGWAWITQVSAVPNLRLSDADRRGWYGELGVGPSLLLPIYRSRDRQFSTHFNFQSHLGVGYTWGERGEHDVSLRVEHYSNAGIRRPNPGVNLGSVRYAYRF